MQRRHARLSVALFAMFALFAALTLVTSVTRADDAATETLELHPGNNFIGWVAEPIAVADIFEQVPEATLIFTWSADSRRWRYVIRDVGGSLETLQPGMAAKIRIDGRKTVKWERSLTPAKGGITLYAGVNWVAWNGRDDWPLDQVARGIGTSLVSIEVRGQLYQPDEETTIAPLRRGDALRVTVNRDLRWLQPTGMMPKIVWVGEISQSVKDHMTADIRDLVDYFADTFGVEANFSDTTILIWNTIDDVVTYQASDPDYPFHLDGKALRTWLETISYGGGTEWGMFAAASWWHPDPSESIFKSWIAHELFHVLQFHYTDRWNTSGRPPAWMQEGTAVWTGETGVRIFDRHQTFEETRRKYLRNAAGTAATLRSAEQRNFPWQYELGLLATDLLVERSGVDSIIEYFRYQHVQTVGPNREWQASPTSAEAFWAAFGLPLEDFYKQFEQWRNALPGRRVRDSKDPMLTGKLHYADGEPATGIWINAAPYEGENEAGRWRRVEVREDGGFAIALQPNTVQRMYVGGPGCYFWLTEGGLVAGRPQPGQYRDLDTHGLPVLNLTLPGAACLHDKNLQVRVFGLKGDDRQIVVFLNSEDRQRWVRAVADSPGSYSAYASKSERYRVMVRVGGCELWYDEGGLVASNQDADVLELSDQPLSIEIRIPHDFCVRQISGRLLYEDGTAARDVWLHLGRGDASSGLLTSAEGEFIVAVPTTGDYMLSFGTDVAGCRIRYSVSGATTDWRRATPITVSDSDVTGIEFVVPDDPASLCR